MSLHERGASSGRLISALEDVQSFHKQLVKDLVVRTRRLEELLDRTRCNGQDASAYQNGRSHTFESAVSSVKDARTVSYRERVSIGEPDDRAKDDDDAYGVHAASLRNAASVAELDEVDVPFADRARVPPRLDIKGVLRESADDYSEPVPQEPPVHRVHPTQQMREESLLVSGPGPVNAPRVTGWSTGSSPPEVFDRTRQTQALVTQTSFQSRAASIQSSRAQTSVTASQPLSRISSGLTSSADDSYPVTVTHTGYTSYRDSLESGRTFSGSVSMSLETNNLTSQQDYRLGHMRPWWKTEEAFLINPRPAARFQSVASIEAKSHLESLRATLATRAAFGTRSKGSQSTFFHHMSHMDATRCGLMHPLSQGRAMWDFTAVLCLCYDFFYTPLQFFELPETGWTRALNWITRIFWMADIGVIFNTMIFFQGNLVTDRCEVAKHYLKHMFALDFTLVVVDWAAYIISVIQDTKGEKMDSFGVFRILRGLRFAKLLRISRFGRVIAALRKRINSNSFFILMKPMQLVVALVFVFHGTACLWYAIGNIGEGGWPRHGVFPESDKGYLYWSSLHWAVALIQGSVDVYPVNSGERGFQCLLSVCAIVLFSYFVSIFTSAILEVHELRHDRTVKLNTVREYLKFRHISPELSFKIKTAVDGAFSASAPQMTMPAETFTLIPEALRMDLDEESRAPILLGNKFFYALALRNRKTLRRICHKAITELICSIGEKVFERRDSCQHMFCIMTGRLIYSLPKRNESDSQSLQMRTKSSEGSESGNSERTPKRVKRFAKMSDTITLSGGSSLCEVTLWMRWQFVGTLNCWSSAMLFTIQADSFGHLIQEFPTTHLSVCRYARSFVSAICATDDLTDLFEHEFPWDSFP